MRETSKRRDDFITEEWKPMKKYHCSDMTTLIPLFFVIIISIFAILSK